jgi:undecaprenyl-diphosphatase
VLRARFVRRALLRALLGAALGWLVPRHRVGGAIAGAAAGALVENPAVGAPLALAAVATRDPIGIGAGALAGLATTRAWPTAPRTVAELRRHNTKRRVAIAPDGAGVVVVVNTGAGSTEDDTASTIRTRLPAATVIEPGEDDDLGEVITRAAKAATTAIGAAGGDGTISAAAFAAAENDLPLLALPAGTLNHFARDAGLLAVDDALDAIVAGEQIEVDLAMVDGRSFLNTASFGAYADLVDARERLEDRIGKWPAVAVSLVGVLRGAEPIEVTVDGRRRRLWLGFIGAGRYEPPGFAPTWREVLDDGVLDVRLVDAEKPFARARLVLAVLTGRLARTPVYEQRVTDSIELQCADDVFKIVLDGEVCEVPPRVTVTKRSTPVRVFAPHR